MQFHFTFQSDTNHPNGGTYVASDNRWQRLEWGLDLDNYPDPAHAALENEYDWECRDDKGVLCSYITHIEGNARIEKKKKRTAGCPVSYWAFCLGAIHLINNPELIRESRRGSVHGGFVVNYVNSIEIESMFPREENGVLLNDSKVYENFINKKHLIPVQYSALLARVFNRSSGIQERHRLKEQPRKPKLGHCPACDAYYELLTRKYARPGDSDYAMFMKNFHEQYIDRHNRDANG